MRFTESSPHMLTSYEPTCSSLPISSCCQRSSISSPIRSSFSRRVFWHNCEELNRTRSPKGIDERSANTVLASLKTFGDCTIESMHLTSSVRGERAPGERLSSTTASGVLTHPLRDQFFVFGGQLIQCSPVDAHRRCRSLLEARREIYVLAKKTNIVGNGA